MNTYSRHHISAICIEQKNVKWHSFYSFCNHVIAKALIVIAQMIVALEKSCHGNHEYHERKIILTAAYCEYHKKKSTINNTGQILWFLDVFVRDKQNSIIGKKIDLTRLQNLFHVIDIHYKQNWSKNTSLQNSKGIFYRLWYRLSINCSLSSVFLNNFWTNWAPSP